MKDAVDLVNEITKNITLLPVYIAEILFLAAFFIFAAGFSEKPRNYILHKRNIGYFIFLCISGGIIAVFRYTGWMTFAVCVFLFLLWSMYLIACIRSLKPRLLITGKKIYLYGIHRHYQRLINEGYLDELSRCLEIYGNFVKRFHIFVDSDRIIEYQMLCYRFYSRWQRYDKAYDALLAIDRKCLYQEELREVDISKAKCLVMMDSFMDAARLLAPEETASAEELLVYGYIYEQKADIERAFRFLQMARADIETGTAENWALFNDYARSVINHGNKPEGIRYLQLSWNLVRKKMNEAGGKLIAGSNLLNTLCELDMKKEAASVFEEYCQLEYRVTLSNILELGNSKIRYYLKTNQKDKAFDAIKEWYASCKKLLNGTGSRRRYTNPAATLEVIKSGAFHQTMDGGYNPDWIKNDISTEYRVYESIPASDRLFILGQYFQILAMESNKALRLSEPFASLWEMICVYYQTEAILDIDAELERTPPYNIKTYVGLWRLKLKILRYMDSVNHVAQWQEMYFSLYQTLKDNGQYIAADDILMDFIDVCRGPENLKLVLSNSLENFVGSYAEYQKTAPVIMPEVSEDGNYKHFIQHIPKVRQVVPVYLELINMIMDMIVTDVRTWEKHPYKPFFAVRILGVLVALNRDDEAKEFYGYYMESGVSDDELNVYGRETVFRYRQEFIN